MRFLRSVKRNAKPGEFVNTRPLDIPRVETGHSITASYKDVPPEVMRLLWFRDGPLKNIPEDALHKNTVNVGGFSISISFKGTVEPSAIGIGDEIRVPINLELVDRPGYYPDYSSLTPEQRWIYLNWLKDVDSIINIGYVFVFYYGIERHLFFGDYETAFNMALRLRAVHKNNSFMSYSSSATILSCMLHDRMDLFLKFIDTIDDSHESEVSPLCLLAKRALGMKLKAPEIIGLARSVGFHNRRYIDGFGDIFLANMASLLERSSKDGSVDLKSYSLDQCPIRRIVVAANFSLPGEQRFLDIPDISQHPEFNGLISRLLQQNHDEVKDRLKNDRKSGKLMVPVVHRTQVPAREPDPVFRGGLLFEEMDIHIFDRNVRCFNDAICPNCHQHLNKVTSRKQKCDACGQTVFQRSNVFTGERMLVTAEESAKLDLIAREGSTRKHIARTILMEKLDVQEIAQRMNLNGITVESAVLEELAICSENHKAESCMGFARNSILQIGQLQEKLNLLEQALRCYLAVCYFDINGADNGRYRFNPQTAFLAPGVLSMISNIARERNLNIDDLRHQFLVAAEEHMSVDMPISPTLAWSRLEVSLQ